MVLTISMNKNRVISQIGDSTDGEDYEKINMVEEPKRKVLLSKKLNKYEYSTYSTSSILKELGNQLLQSLKIRSGYKSIKSTFTEHLTSAEQNELEELDQKFGRGWGIIVKHYDKEHQIVKEPGARKYYEINRKKINKACSQDTQYNQLEKEEKANFYLREKVDLQDKLKVIYDLNKKIASHAQSQRKSVEPMFMIGSFKDASLFLVQVKAVKKLDKDLGKLCLYDFRFGTKKHITVTSITKKTTQVNETLEVHTAGGLSDYITDEGSYETIGKRLEEFVTNGLIHKNKWSEFFQAALRGQRYDNIIIRKDELSTELIDQLQTLVKLMFGVEVKRNTAALLTNAMFFELVDAGEYKIGQIADKMPMTIPNAVIASILIDQTMGYITYDYREILKGSRAAKELLKRDETIIQEWLQWKLQVKAKIKEKFAEEISKLDTLEEKSLNLTLKDQDDAFDTSSRKKKFNDSNTQIIFQLSNCKVIARLAWCAASNEYEVKICQIQQVVGKVFYDLITEWYGIELTSLNIDKQIKVLKAGGQNNKSNVIIDFTHFCTSINAQDDQESRDALIPSSDWFYPFDTVLAIGSSTVVE